MKSAATIERIHAREVLDSRGNPTIEVEVHCPGGRGRAIVPSGASTGRHEAIELRDGDISHFGGLGVRQAIENVHCEIAPRLLDLEATNQERIDFLLCEIDGTPNKSRLGANATLGVSLACAHASADIQRIPLWKYLDTKDRAKLPLPMINLISGGLHAGGNLDFQDFLLLPIGVTTYSQALEMTGRVYRCLGRLLTSKGYEAKLVGDEGGFGPRLKSNEEAFQLIVKAIQEADYIPGKDAAIAIDVASTHFYDDVAHRYHLKAFGSHHLTSEEMICVLESFVHRYPVWSIEDGLAEDDWTGWQELTERLGKRIQLIGDDLFVTNPARLQRGIRAGIGNSVLIKPNQIGTLTETLQVIDMAREAGYRPVISARSGETEDSTIADLAVATGVGQIKIGSIARSERLAKYNQLLRIEEQLRGEKHFLGWNPVDTPIR
jgi:enolase